jgi:hypothetical protein
MKHWWVTAILLGGVAIFSGCGSSEAEVSGTVLMDRQPLKEGDIIFEEEDNSKTPVAGMIVDGKYTVKMVPGNKRVRIKASRPTKTPDPVMGTAARESMIAREFNEQSKLTVDVKPGQQRDVNFEVTSIP